MFLMFQAENDRFSYLECDYKPITSCSSDEGGLPVLRTEQWEIIDMTDRDYGIMVSSR